MYNVSQNYHNLITSGAEQNLLIIFSDLYLSGLDHDFEVSGAELQEYFNPSTDIKIGEVSSSVFSCSVLNLDGLLDTFTWGEGKPYIGVKTGTGTYTRPNDATAYAVYTDTNGGEHIIIGHSGNVSVDGTNYSTASNPVLSIMVWDEVAWIVTSANIYKYHYSVNTSSWTGQTIAVNDFMLAKGSVSMSLSKGLYTLYNEDGTTEEWEYCPLGVFNFETPAKRQVPVINVSAYDRMAAFDIDAKEYLESGWTYPVTLGEMFQTLCEYVGVPFVLSYNDMEVVYDAETKTLSIGGITHSYADYALTIGNVDHSYSQPTLTVNGQTHGFTNSDMEFVAFPTLRATITCRQLLSYIAEASGNVAVFNRDGELELRWFGQIPVIRLDENDIPLNQYDVAEYVTPQVTGLRSLLTDGTEINLGTGDNIYTILANSFLADDATRYQPVFTKIQSVGEYTPTSAQIITADPSIEGGDIVNLLGKDIPLMSQVIRWKGYTAATYTATGLAHRELPSSLERNDFVVARNLALAEQYADDAVSDYDDTLNQQKVFNKLTNNGQAQGIYLNDGNLYINAAYIATGVLASPNGKYSLNMLTGEVNMASANITGGSINIETSSANLDKIRLAYQSVLLGETIDYEAKVSSSEITAVQTTTDSSNNVTVRKAWIGGGINYSREVNGVEQYRVEVQDDAYYAVDRSFGVMTMQNVEEFDVYDKSRGDNAFHPRMRLRADGLSFLDSNENETASYPDAPSSFSITRDNVPSGGNDYSHGYRLGNIVTVQFAGNISAGTVRRRIASGLPSAPSEAYGVLCNTATRESISVVVPWGSTELLTDTIIPSDGYFMGQIVYITG